VQWHGYGRHFWRAACSARRQHLLWVLTCVSRQEAQPWPRHFTVQACRSSCSSGRRRCARRLPDSLCRRRVSPAGRRIALLCFKQNLIKHPKTCFERATALTDVNTPLTIAGGGGRALCGGAAPHNFLGAAAGSGRWREGAAGSDRATGACAVSNSALQTGVTGGQLHAAAWCNAGRVPDVRWLT
jgi:hypothetical protein